MVYAYKRKSNRGNWNEADMQRALEATRNHEMGWLKASKTFNVPTATLRRRGLNKNKIAKEVNKYLGSIKSTLSMEVEQAIVNHILDLESRFFGLSTIDVRKLAFEIAEKMKIKHTFNKNLKMAGKGWLNGFRKRNPQLSLRLPEATSLARAEAFNKPQVSKFFAKLEEVININKIANTMIFNMDESALTTVQVPPKIFAQRGKKQVGALTSAERGVHSTIVVCISSGGTFVPPSIIFPRKRFNPDLYDGAPVGTLKLHNESGYMTSDLFLKWMQHFVDFVRPNQDQKALLILDGHLSHKSFEALEFAKNHSVVLLCLPAHCTHHLQPLDVAFFGPLRKHYNCALTQWLRQNPGRTVTIYQVSKLFSTAYEKAATIEIALSGFRATGISPLNPNIFPDHVFLPSLTTDVPDTTPGPVLINNETLKSPSLDKSVDEAGPSTSKDYIEAGPSTSMEDEDEVDPSTPAEDDIQSMLHQLSPIPQSTQRKSTKRKSSNYQDVLTESPYLQSIREKENEKKQEQDRKKQRNVVKKKVFEDLQTKENKMKEVTQRKSQRNVANKKVFYDLSDEESEEDPFSAVDDEEDCACLYCNDVFSRSKSREEWLRCQLCLQWCHSECAGVSKSSKMFICELCQP